MKMNTPKNKSKTRFQPEILIRQAKALREQERYQSALDICLQITRTHPGLGAVWGYAAANCAHLNRWQEAVQYGQAALARGGKAQEIYAALSQGYETLGQPDEVRRYGLQALKMLDQEYGGHPVIPLPETRAMPPLPSPQTRERNIIAFSLFGSECKYCEPAILNVQEQQQIYPHWICRFYVDNSVPGNVISRLLTGGAQIVTVDGPAAQWPGPMWRLLALDDPQAHRVLFRDADSVISQREAKAVEQWLTSGKRFHMMRDAGSHTELMLAGMWGMVSGSLPPLQPLMNRFMSTPLKSGYAWRYADQHFLRQHIWPYARTSLMQHDSVFGFMDAVPFPDGARPNDGFTVGCGECSGSFSVKTDLPEGSEVTWTLFRNGNEHDGQALMKLICAYPGIVKNGAVSVKVPRRYGTWIKQGMGRVSVCASNSGSA